MIRDLTIGQYFPAKSILHQMDPRIKVLLTLALIILIFSTGNYVALGLVTVFAFLMVFLSGISMKLYLKSLKMVLFLVLFTAILNLFYGVGEPIFQWGFLKITEAGINNSIFVFIRITSLILVSSVLTFTTTPTDLTDGLERLMQPLKLFHVKVSEIAMMMTIAMRFVPTRLEETDKITNAQKARGADLESGGFIQRMRALIPILVPLFVSSFRRAYDLAMAMECRCYRGGDHRTRMKTLHMKTLDGCAILVVGLLCTGVILCNIRLVPTIR